MTLRLRIANLSIVLSLAIASDASAQAPVTMTAPPPACEDSTLYRALDFWIGEWDVYVGNRIVGHNRIEKILDGCAVMEHWSARGGEDGKSLFFVDYNGHWVQVWVTQWARTPGGVKEKLMVTDPPEGTVRFQGVIRHPEAGEWLDRTTLTPNDDGSVHQLIEFSEDNGQTWNPTFDAIYRAVSEETGPN